MLTGGYGVDMFFVLSGFLITGILLDSKTSPGYFKTFYMRRLLRIFPLYYGVLAVCFGLLWWTPVIHQFVPRQGWLWLYGANFTQLAGFNFEPVFAHFWSLAVEEHFYLLWPVVVLVLSRRNLMLGSTALTLGSALLRCMVIASGRLDPDSTAMLTPLRLDGLAMGALLAAISRGPCGLANFRNLAIWLVAVGGLASGLLKVLYGSVSDSVWGLSGAGHFTISVTVAGILTLAVTNSRGIWARALNNGFLRFMGKYSYGLYVYHYLLQPWTDSQFWFLGNSLPTLSLVVHVIVASGVTLIVSLASWHLFEKQFLRLKRLFEYSSARATGDSQAQLSDKLRQAA
jgi:peptidoglycan/LPS O-acetylase OafA/YrhL